MKEGEYIVLNESNKSAIDKFCLENEYIYRYLPLERFLEVLHKKQLTFVSPKKWNDPVDNFLFKQKIDNSQSFINKLYVMCFTHNPHSFAYWKTYAPEGYCVRLRIRTDKFLKLMTNNKDRVWLGKMKYQNQSVLIESLQQTIGLKNALEQNKINDIFIKTFLLKRMPFKYEEESRIIIQSYPHHTQLRKVNINLKDIISDILLDPRMQKNETIAWKNYLEKFGITVRKSLLFAEKDIKIQ
jgi:hypothetical protein